MDVGSQSTRKQFVQYRDLEGEAVNTLKMRAERMCVVTQRVIQ